MAGAPRGDRRHHRRREPGPGVGQVAEHHQSLRPATGDRPIEPRQVAFGAALRHGDRSPPEGRRLAQVRVGDQQGGLRRPVERVLGEQQHPLPG